MSVYTYRTMLSYMRPMGSKTEAAFIARFISTLPGAYQDPQKNWHVVTDPTSTILWCAHTDTVHVKEGRQTLHIDEQNIIMLSRRSRFGPSSCMGADDTSGCYLLREMILAGVAGHYIFHYGEERGGVGSSDLAHENPEFFKPFTHAIALDRGGKSDVITHQAWSRSASDAFAASMALALGLPSYKACEHGIYTDTAEYIELVSECSNISVGYEGAHTKNETQDLTHLAALRAALIAMDTSLLVSERNPEDRDVMARGRWDYLDDFYDRFNGWKREQTVVEFTRNDVFARCADCYEFEDECMCGAEDRDIPPSPYLDPEFDKVQSALLTPHRRLYNHLRETCEHCGRERHSAIHVCWPKGRGY